jgi:hypothetical protein
MDDASSVAYSNQRNAAGPTTAMSPEEFQAQRAGPASERGRRDGSMTGTIRAADGTISSSNFAEADEFAQQPF